MNLTAIKPNDIVQVDLKGDRFFGVVREKEQRQLAIRPINPGRGGVRLVTSRQVISHYRKSKASRV